MEASCFNEMEKNIRKLHLNVVLHTHLPFQNQIVLPWLVTLDLSQKAEKGILPWLVLKSIKRKVNIDNTCIKNILFGFVEFVMGNGR